MLLLLLLLLLMPLLLLSPAAGTNHSRVKHPIHTAGAPDLGGGRPGCAWDAGRVSSPYLLFTSTYSHLLITERPIPLHPTVLHPAPFHPSLLHPTPRCTIPPHPSPPPGHCNVFPPSVQYGDGMAQHTNNQLRSLLDRWRAEGNV